MESWFVGLRACIEPIRSGLGLYPVCYRKLCHSLCADVARGYEWHQHRRITQLPFAQWPKSLLVWRERGGSSFRIRTMVDSSNGRLATCGHTSHFFQHDVDSATGPSNVGDI